MEKVKRIIARLGMRVTLIAVALANFYWVVSGKEGNVGLIEIVLTAIVVLVGVFPDMVKKWRD